MRRLPLLWLAQWAGFTVGAVCIALAFKYGADVELGWWWVLFGVGMGICLGVSRG